MTTYENAPATRILATHCACCGRALLDAVSVEAGIGPDCRAKYGYGMFDVDPGPEGWTKAAAALGGASGVAKIDALSDAWYADGGSPEAARRAANLLVHAIASESQAVRRGPCVVAIAHLGFVKLARKLGERAGAILIDEKDGLLRIKAPYSPTFNETIRGVPGQRWNPADKVRTVPPSAREALWMALKAAFPVGTPVFGRLGAGVL